MIRSFYQTHECAGYRAKITVEWSAPEGIDMDELDRHRMEAAEEIASEVFGIGSLTVYEIVQAMRGRSTEPRSR